MSIVKVNSCLVKSMRDVKHQSLAITCVYSAYLYSTCFLTSLRSEDISEAQQDVL